MGRVWLAFQVFFDALFNAERAEQFRRLEATSPDSATSTPAPESAPAPTAGEPPSPPQPSGRSDALSLLETLQREARLIDFLQEDIEGYTDQQVGSAVREIHRGSRQVLERLFKIAPVLNETEGNQVTVTSDQGPARIRLTGRVVETRPVTGTLVHAGWRAERCELPQWNGTAEAAMILSPAEVELT